MTETTRRRIGKLPVADCFSDKHVARVLPPEHSILAVRPDPDFGLTDYLIEGPMLPEVASTSPTVLTVLFTMTMVDDNGRVRMTGEWSGCDAVGSWTVGEWESVDTYRAEMEAVDASR